MNQQDAFTTIREFISGTAPESQEQLDWREVELNSFTFQLLGCNGSNGYVRVEYLDTVIANEHPTFACFDADAAERALAVIESARRSATVSRLINRAADDDGEEVSLSTFGPIRFPDDPMIFKGTMKEFFDRVI